MQLSSTEVDGLAELPGFVRVVRSAQFLLLASVSRVVDNNQHNLDGARSAAAWAGALLGVPERVAARQLAAFRMLQVNPDVLELAESGVISFEKAELVVRAARGSDSVTQALLPHVVSDSYEALRQRCHDVVASGESGSARRSRLRDSQFVSVDRDRDNMVFGRFRLLPENAARWLPRWRELEQSALRENDKLVEPLPEGAARAEAFCSMLSASGGSSKAVVNYHVRLEDWRSGWSSGPATCELAGVGVVPLGAVQGLSEHPALRLLINSRNKLLWYSEATYRSDGPLPEFVKRAVRADFGDRCCTPGCVGSADEVDHIRARTNGGDNAFENLQPLCEEHHVVKTKRDAPWTAGGIYGRRTRAGPLADTG